MLGVFHRGDVVRKLREAQGWTQQQLAKRAGINTSTVQRVEQNAPSVELGSLGRIAAALGVPVDYLQHASADVTAPVSVGGHTAVFAGEAVMPDTAKAQLVAQVQSLNESEAALLLPQVRLWLVRLWQHQTQQQQK